MIKTETIKPMITKPEYHKHYKGSIVPGEKCSVFHDIFVLSFNKILSLYMKGMIIIMYELFLRTLHLIPLLGWYNFPFCQTICSDFLQYNRIQNC
jgi:antibiotic biosynthesis monooxygenase (ABM) superfamily enzyme